MLQKSVVSFCILSKSCMRLLSLTLSGSMPTLNPKPKLSMQLSLPLWCSFKSIEAFWNSKMLVLNLKNRRLARFRKAKQLWKYVVQYFHVCFSIYHMWKIPDVIIKSKFKWCFKLISLDSNQVMLYIYAQGDTKGINIQKFNYNSLAQCLLI